LTIFQDLATLAGYDPVRGPGSSCMGRNASGKCVLPWGNGTKSVSSVVLLANGISFAVCHIIYVLDLPLLVIMNILFQITTITLTAIGPVADYGTLGKWPLLVTTIIYWASMFSVMTLTCKYGTSSYTTYASAPYFYDIAPSRWGAAMAVYIIGFTSYGIMLAFYAAVFPRLARNTRTMCEYREMYDQGRITAKVYEQAEALERSKISSLSMARAIPILLQRKIMISFSLFRLLAPSASSHCYR
jgi:hypothetical protein